MAREFAENEGRLVENMIDKMILYYIDLSDETRDIVDECALVENRSINDMIKKMIKH